MDSVEKIIPSLNSDTGTNTPTEDSGVKDENHDDDEEGEGEGEGELPDHDERSIANTRPPKTADGIIEVDEMVRLMREVLPGGARSALGSIPQRPATSSAEAEVAEAETFGTRGGLDGLSESHGRDEPAYTCFTPLFKLTLGKFTLSTHMDGVRPTRNQCRTASELAIDYIFILSPLESRNIDTRPASSMPDVSVIEHLRQARISELGNGLPRKGICASDHLAVGCGIVW